MSPNKVLAGSATYGQPRRRKPLVLAPRSRICGACLTDTEVTTCPANCLTRTEESR